MKIIDGKYEFAKEYIASKTDFQKVLTDCGQLRVIAVYSNGDCEYTVLASYIEEARLCNGFFMIKVNGCKKELKLMLI